MKTSLKVGLIATVILWICVTLIDINRPQSAPIINDEKTEYVVWEGAETQRQLTELGCRPCSPQGDLQQCIDICLEQHARLELVPYADENGNWHWVDSNRMRSDHR